MKKNSIKFLIAITLSLAIINAIAAETFGLVRVATPYKFKDAQYPKLEDPADRESNLLVEITIKDNKLIFNDESCNYEISKIVPFYVSRTLVDIIDGAGGDDKFKRFLKTKLHTNMEQWKTEYFLKVSDKELDNAACELLQNGIIYRSKNELIITDAMFFYRFVLGK